MVLVAQRAQVFALFALFIRVEARLLELVVRNGVFHAMHDELDALLDLGQLVGRVVWRSFTRAPASSIRSMALSGRKRSGM